MTKKFSRSRFSQDLLRKGRFSESAYQSNLVTNLYFGRQKSVKGITLQQILCHLVEGGHYLLLVTLLRFYQNVDRNFDQRSHDYLVEIKESAFGLEASSGVE